MNNKNPTFVTTARFDIRVAAQLILFWESQNVIIKSRAQLIEQSIYALADMVSAKDCASKIDSTEYALRILQERGIIQQVPVRNKRALIKALSLGDIKTEAKPKTLLSETEEQEALKLMTEEIDKKCLDIN